MPEQFKRANILINPDNLAARLQHPGLLALDWITFLPSGYENEGDPGNTKLKDASNELKKRFGNLNWEVKYVGPDQVVIEAGDAFEDIGLNHTLALDRAGTYVHYSLSDRSNSAIPASVSTKRQLEGANTLKRIHEVDEAMTVTYINDEKPTQYQAVKQK